MGDHLLVKRDFVFTPVHHHPSSSSSFNLLFIPRKNVYCTIFLLGPISRILTLTLKHSHSQLSLSLFQVFLVSWSQFFFMNVKMAHNQCFHRNPVVYPLLLLYCVHVHGRLFLSFSCSSTTLLFEETHTVSYAPVMSSPCIFDFTFFGLPFSFSFLSFGDRFGYKFRRKASVFFTSRQSKS